MNLTYRDFNAVKTTLNKLLASAIIQNFEDTLIIADIKEPFDKIDGKYVKGYNTISYKYGILAEGRISENEPKGYNTIAEVEAMSLEQEAFLDKTDDASFNFKPISKETIKLLFEGTPEIIEVEKDGKKIKRETGVKLNNINAADIAVLNKLGLRKGKTAPKPKKKQEGK